jgi:predicted nucleic acid-binding protein
MSSGVSFQQRKSSNVVVVADTSPLNYLILLGHGEVLELIYGSVMAPRAVITEMLHLDAPTPVRSTAANPPAWLQTADVNQIDDTLPIELGAGEREAISLALEVNADILLIDEFAGRRQAEARNLTVTGTLAVLLQASLLGHLHFPAELQRLIDGGFRVSPRVAAHMLWRWERNEDRN